MNDALIFAVYIQIHERLRRQGVVVDDRDELAADAMAEFFTQNPELFHTILSSSSIALLVLHFATNLPVKKAKHRLYEERNRRAQHEFPLDLTSPENDRFYASNESPARLAEFNDCLDAIRRYANELDDYRGCCRYQIAIAEMKGSDDLADLAKRLGVGVKSLQRVNEKTFEHVRFRFADALD